MADPSSPRSPSPGPGSGTSPPHQGPRNPPGEPSRNETPSDPSNRPDGNKRLEDDPEVECTGSRSFASLPGPTPQPPPGGPSAPNGPMLPPPLPFGRGSVVPDENTRRRMREESSIFLEQDEAVQLNLEEDGIRIFELSQVGELASAAAIRRWDAKKAEKEAKSATPHTLSQNEEDIQIVKTEHRKEPALTTIPHVSANGQARNAGVRAVANSPNEPDEPDEPPQPPEGDDDDDDDYDSDDEDDEDGRGDQEKGSLPRKRARKPRNKGQAPARGPSAKAKGEQSVGSVDPLPSGPDETTDTPNDAAESGDDRMEDAIGAAEYKRGQEYEKRLNELRFLKARKAYLESLATHGKLSMEDALTLRVVTGHIERDLEELDITEQDLEEQPVLPAPSASSADGGDSSKAGRKKKNGKNDSNTLVAKLMGKGRGKRGPRAPPSLDGRAAARKRRAPGSLADGSAVKRAKTSNGSSQLVGNSRLKRSKNQTDETAHMLFEMVRDADPIMSRAGQGDIPLPPVLRATNVHQQVKEIREKYARDPNDMARVESDLRLLEWARGVFGRGRVRARHGQWRVKGMVTWLYHYQLFGAAWMLQREKGEDNILGGIQADAMGMGKTLMCIAMILSNAPTDDEKKKGRGATLVVCPASAVQQWYSEIQKHCDVPKQKKQRLVVLIHRESQKLDISVLSACDVVITSYHEVQRSHPSQAKVNELASMGLSIDEYSEQLSETLGNLFKVSWHRVILDEGHHIKNYQSATSKAAIHLRSKYRWIVSGTPIQNTLAELYPYMRFLRVPCSANWLEFRDKFGVPKTEEAAEQLRTIVYSITLKRGLDAAFLGLPIHSLPMTHPLPIRWVSFSKEEALIYRRIEGRFREDLNQRIADGSIKKNLITYFNLMMRLRQATSHPFLLEGLMREFFVLEDIRWLRTQLNCLGGKRPLVEQIGRWCEEAEESEVRESANAAAATSSGPADGHNKDSTSQNGGEEGGDTLGNAGERDDGEGPNTAAAAAPVDAPANKRKHGMAFNLDAQLSMVEKGKNGKTTLCSVCLEPPIDPQWTGCGHVFCMVCIEAKASEELEDDIAIAHCPHPQCGAEIEEPTPFDLPCQTKRDRSNGKDGDDSSDTTDSDATAGAESDEGGEGPGKRSAKNRRPTKSTRRGYRRKGKKRTTRKRGDDVNCFQPFTHTGFDRFLREADKQAAAHGTPLTPSAKTTAVMDAIHKWQAEAPDDKIIVFTQFVMTAQVLGRVLQDENIGFLYFFGDLHTFDKEQWLADFHERPEIKVMIVSMRCGGQALNLTCANRVVLVDVWWNHAMEQQAFGRVFRIGQTKETWFLRIMVRNSIDVRLFDLQEEKMRHIGKTVREHDSRQVSWEMDSTELGSLAGRVVQHVDADGKRTLVVESDYEDEDDTEAKNAEEERVKEVAEAAAADKKWAEDFQKNVGVEDKVVDDTDADADADTGGATAMPSNANGGKSAAEPMDLDATIEIPDDDEELDGQADAGEAEEDEGVARPE